MIFGQNISIGIFICFLVPFSVINSSVSAQIHWNRGWGAGGSLGKRSSTLIDNPTIITEDEPLVKTQTELIDLISDATCDGQQQEYIINIMQMALSKLLQCHSSDQGLISNEVLKRYAAVPSPLKKTLYPIVQSHIWKRSNQREKILHSAEN